MMKPLLIGKQIWKFRWQLIELLYESVIRIYVYYIYIFARDMNELFVKYRDGNLLTL